MPVTALPSRPPRAPAPVIARPRLTGYEAHREIDGLRKQRGEWFVIGVFCGLVCGVATAFIAFDGLGWFLG